MTFTLSSLEELVSLEACELVRLDSVVSLDVLTKLELPLRDDEIELEPVMLDPVPLLLTLLESKVLEPETLRSLVLSVVTLEPPWPLKSVEETLDKLRALELKLDVLVVPDMLDPETLLLGLKGGEEFA